jgi:hypothetical protein
MLRQFSHVINHKVMQYLQLRGALVSRLQTLVAATSANTCKHICMQTIVRLGRGNAMQHFVISKQIGSADGLKTEK